MMEWQCEFLSVLAEAVQVEFERRAEGIAQGMQQRGAS